MARNIKVKPGKTQSMFGFAVGILFCGIGLFVAIPMFGLFGFFWTAVAVFITISHGMNAFSNKGIPTYEVNIEEDNSDIEARLRKLDSLYQQGLITKEEFEKKRKDILNDI